MKQQIAVRLDADLVATLDRLVAAGEARSRADLIESALERELRRQLYEREARILDEDAADPDLDGLVQWSANHPVSVD
jgi:Arc/MetJ-type ribon-helix-helix transcriptional regulator